MLSLLILIPMAAAAIPTQQGMITPHTVTKSQIMSENSIIRKIDDIANFNFCNKKLMNYCDHCKF